MHESIAVKLANPGTHLGDDCETEQIGMDREREDEDDRKDDESQPRAGAFHQFEFFISHDRVSPFGFLIHSRSRTKQYIPSRTPNTGHMPQTTSQ
jgi:hypothetical protein